MNFSIESFIHSRFARVGRWVLAGVVVYGVGGEYHIMHSYEAFPKTEAREWVVDFSPISRPKAQLYVLPDLLYANYSPWTPVNGDVVLGRVVESNPQWVQLIGGRFLERRSCGVDLVIPKEDYDHVLAQRAAEAAAVPMGAEKLKPAQGPTPVLRGSLEPKENRRSTRFS